MTRKYIMSSYSRIQRATVPAPAVLILPGKIASFTKFKIWTSGIRRIETSSSYVSICEDLQRFIIGLASDPAQKQPPYSKKNKSRGRREWYFDSLSFGGEASLRTNSTVAHFASWIRACNIFDFAPSSVVQSRETWTFWRLQQRRWCRGQGCGSRCNRWFVFLVSKRSTFVVEKSLQSENQKRVNPRQQQLL